MRRKSKSIAVLAFLVVAGAAAAAPPADMEAVIEEYEADLNSVSGFYDLSWSASRFDRLDRLEHDWKDRLTRVDFDGLDQHGRVDWLLLRPRSGQSSTIGRSSANAWSR